MEDARFEDGTPERPLRLKAETNDDLVVISTLVQDAVAQTSDMSWLSKKHRFALLLNRFRWEDADAAQKADRPFERVQSMMTIESVLSVQGQGVDPSDEDIALDLLSVSFEESEDAAGKVMLTFSGDGAIALDVECLDVTLLDMSRPYQARAQRRPSHPEDA